MTTGKTIALTRWTFVGKVMSLLFNMLFKLVITFLPRYLLISWLHSSYAVIFGAPKNEVCHYFHCFPICLLWSDGTRCHDLVFWKLSFKPAFSPSSRGSLVPLCFLHIRVVSSACLRLLLFLPAILIPAWASSSLVFHMMYSACKLNKQGDSRQPWYTPFLPNFEPVCSMSSSNCCFLTCIQVSQEAGKVVWYPHLFQNSPQCVVIHTIKGFSV